MANYSVATAKDKLSSLIAKAEAGEEVIITRRGKPTVELRVVRPEKRDRKAVMAWLKEQREKLPAVSITSAEILRLENEDLRY